MQYLAEVPIEAPPSGVTAALDPYLRTPTGPALALQHVCVGVSFAKTGTERRDGRQNQRERLLPSVGLRSPRRVQILRILHGALPRTTAFNRHVEARRSASTNGRHGSNWRTLGSPRTDMSWVTTIWRPNPATLLLLDLRHQGLGQPCEIWCNLQGRSETDRRTSKLESVNGLTEDPRRSRTLRFS